MSPASLLASASLHRIDYLPGAAELGDFDPASSTIAFAPGGNTRAVPRQLIQPTFERYWREFVDRRDGRKAWEDYTPYELRTVGTFVRLGWRDRAHDSARILHGRPPSRGLESMGRGRRPRCAQASLRRRHAACLDRVRFHPFGSRYVRVRAQRRRSAGARCRRSDPSWLEGDGIRVAGTAYAVRPPELPMRRSGHRLLLHVDDGIRLPPGGIVVTWPGIGRQGPRESTASRPRGR